MTDTIIGEESEMLHLQGIFAKAANAIVEASQLRKEVASLQVQMKQLSESVDALRISNEQLVSELHALRQEKAEIQGKLWQTESEVANLKVQVEQREAANEAQRRVIESLEGDLKAAKEGNANLRQVLSAESEEVAKLRGELERIRTAFGRFEKATDGWRKAEEEAFSAFANVVVERFEAVQEVQPAEPVAEAPSAIPFVHGNGEQPRAEDGKFEPVPMAARHFE